MQEGVDAVSPRDVLRLVQEEGYTLVDTRIQWCGANPSLPERKSRSRETSSFPKTDLTVLRLLHAPCTLVQLLGLRHRRSQRSVAWQCRALRATWEVAAPDAGG